MKTSKRIVSFLLSAIMVVTTFLAVGPVFTIEAEAADITIGGITQKRVVNDYKLTYQGYRNRFFGGAETNRPTDFVIPGLASTDDYTPQGMTYWAEKEWILISAYHAASSNKKNSVIYALDAKTTEFVALFNIQNSDGSWNYSHGGGIAASGYNFYYADSDSGSDEGSRISYWPLEDMDVAPGTAKTVRIRDSIYCGGELAGANTSYCCYDDGVLWAGNFYHSNESAYDTPANASYHSLLVGYRLRGNSSELEWKYLCKENHPMTVSAYTNSAQSGSQRFYVTAPSSASYMRLRFGVRNSNGATVKFSNIKVYEVSNSGTNLFNFANWASYNNGGCQGGSISNDTNSNTITISASSSDAYSNPWDGAGGNASVSVTAGKTYCVSYNYQVSGLSSAQLEPFVFWDNNTTNGDGESERVCVPFVSSANVFTSSKNDALMTYTLNSDANGIDVTGSIVKDLAVSAGGTAIGEIAPKFASVWLDKGRQYKVSYTTTNQDTDIYLFSPSGHHTNVKQSSATTITNNGNGTYTYSMIFAAGEEPPRADSSWAENPNGTYSGIYSIRFDQDNIKENRDFKITDFKIESYNEDYDASMLGTDCEGNPTYVIALNNDLDRVQYAMVDKGKVYISRSWSRKPSAYHIRELVIGDMDLNDPGSITLNINGTDRRCHLVDSQYVTKFGGSEKANGDTSGSPEKMLYMGEALCVIDGYLYMFGEGAAWNYNGKASDNVCVEPIDVIWKIDQHAIIGNTRPVEEVEASHYERVYNLSELNADDEYVIFHKSQLKDPVTQQEMLYFLDSDGGYGVRRLPKDDNPDSESTGDSLGMLPYSINSYTEDEDGDILYLDAEHDENRSIRWKISGSSSAGYQITNRDYYFENHPYLYFTGRHIVMSSEDNSLLSNMGIQPVDGKPGLFYITSKRANFYESYLWCNDGTVPGYVDKYTEYYQGNNYALGNYNGHYEVVGTFHPDAAGTATSGTGSATKDILGAAIKTEEYYMGEFYIYKRIENEFASLAQTRMYTDLDFKLQPDGTYDLTLEAYAIGNTQFEKTTEEKPTDYIFVVDASQSIANTDESNRTSAGYEYKYSNLDLKTAAGTADAADNKNNTYSDGNIYVFNDADGSYRKLSVETGKGYKNGTTTYIYIWLYYTDDNGTKYYAQYPSSSNTNVTSFSTDKPAKENTLNLGGYSADGLIDPRSSKTIYSGEHYVNYNNSTGATRLDTIRNIMVDMTYDIAEQNSQNRVAFVQFGSTDYNTAGGSAWQNSGFYTTTSSSMISVNGATDAQYGAALHNTSQFTELRNDMRHMPAGSCDKQAELGLKMANNILAQSGSDYAAGGDRNACVILLTDNAAGYHSGQDMATATAACNSSVMYASRIKQQCAYLYAVRIGEFSPNPTDFNVQDYLSCISSEYIDASSLQDRGMKNITGVDFTLTLPMAKYDVLAQGAKLLASIKLNQGNALARLDEKTYLRENINYGAFIIPEGTVPEVRTAEGHHDGLGRLYFDEPVNDSVSQAITSYLEDEEDGTQSVIAHGFDYSYYNLSEDRLTGSAPVGRKMVITFRGVLPAIDLDRTDGFLANEAINNSSLTALYRTEQHMINNIPFKSFPTDRIIIPQYTYVLDYGMDMLDIDINGTLCSVDTQLRAQDPNAYKKSAVTDDTALVFTNNDQDMIYSIEPDATGMSKQYVLIQRDNGDYDWFGINIVPASNVYHEDTVVNTSGTATGTAKWTTEGSPKFTYQTVDIYDAVYGYDQQYKTNDALFSNNTALKSVVSSTNKTSDVASFTFTGYGFDLYSACGTTTGVQVIAIRDAVTRSLVKSYVIDTYYNQVEYNQQFTQIPILRFKCPADADGSTYRNFIVESTAAYLPSLSGALKAQSVESQVIGENGVVSYTTEFAESYENEILRELGFEELIGTDIEFIAFSEDSVLNGGEGPFAVEEGAFTTQSVTELVNYIDGYRIYNPCGDNADVNSYYAKSEVGATYYNVVDILSDTDNFFSKNEGTVYLEKTDNVLESILYNSLGTPKNEFYLIGGEDNTFSFKIPNWNSSMRVMVSARAAYGTPQLKVNTKYSTIDSRTEMYYDITDYMIDDGKFVISNSGTGLLALNNIKVVDAASMPGLLFETAGTIEEIQAILDMPAEEIELNAPKLELGDSAPPEIGEIGSGDNSESDDGNDNILPPSDDDNPEEPAEDGFFAKVESFFVKIFNFFKNIFNKVFSFFEF
ncbi:MAG: hypothetical protein IJC13_07785 [Clostridia bacterium]|nr:hypothetical protein [Clostridia bacterium]